MAISRDEVEHVAKLARLELSNEEIELFTDQLGVILEHASRVTALDTEDVPPTAHPIEVTNVWREDIAKPTLNRDEVLANAPATEEGKFRVPRIMEAEEAGS